MGMMILHRCDTRHCVRPDHLRVGTAADNAADMMRKGRQQHGEKHYRAKLTEQSVRDIRAEYSTGKATQETLAVRYRVSQTVIGKVVRKNTWKHVT